MSEPSASVARASDRIVTASWAGTAAFVVTASGAVASAGMRPVATIVALALFAAGTVVFLWAYAIAVNRSRTDAIGIGGLYFLAGETAPASVRRQLMAALAVQVVGALATASARPFTSLAFGILVPVYGLGLAGLWGARHGRFGSRANPAAR